MTFIICYLIVINIVSAIVFSYDKRCAVAHKRRVSETVLHILELVGGVFSVLFLMYRIHHKNKKFSYYSYTYIVLVLWLILFYFIIGHFFPELNLPWSY